MLEWDESKRQENRQKHGIDFADLEPFFHSDLLTVPDDRFDYGEIRYISYGLLVDRVIAVVHTPRANRQRLISARYAGKNETDAYYEEQGI